MRIPFGSPWEGRAQRPQWLTRLLRPAWLGAGRRTTPLSDIWGYDRGEPVDRYYIEGFLDRHSQDIRGRVLEIKDAKYTERFGSGVTERDVLDIDPANARTTIVADLTNASEVPGDRFDCCIVTQTLQYIYAMDAAVAELHRILRPGGVLLATVPSVSRLDLDEGFVDYWRLTPAACRRLFGDVFGDNAVEVAGFGNVLTAIGTLTGMAQEDLSRRQLEAHDVRFPVIVTVRAVKGATGRGGAGSTPP